MDRPLRIALVEPFYTDSHRAWADGLAHHSRHHIVLYTLKGHHWKWRMHGGAVTLAQEVAEEPRPDLILATDMLDVATFKALMPSHWASVPISLYMHENQLTYPWSPTDADPGQHRDRHYAWINYTSCLAADRIYFNSTYHRNSFLGALPGFLRAFPDYRGLDNVDRISAKAEVMYLGLDLERRGGEDRPHAVPRIVWNHRWEYDKNPETFFQSLMALAEEEVAFEVIVLGRAYPQSPEIFEQAREALADRILHWGYAETRTDYLRWLGEGDVLPVTSRQDFFGISVVEGIYAGLLPILQRRLAYTDYVDPNRFAHLYYDQEEILPLLRKVLQNWPNTYQDLSVNVAEFDWSKCISDYDHRLADY